jgi:hypothetical protein
VLHELRRRGICTSKRRVERALRGMALGSGASGVRAREPDMMNGGNVGVA